MNTVLSITLMFTFLGCLMAGFVKFVFFTATFGYWIMVFSVISLFAVMGLLLGIFLCVFDYLVRE